MKIVIRKDLSGNWYFLPIELIKEFDRLHILIMGRDNFDRMLDKEFRDKFLEYKTKFPITKYIFKDPETIEVIPVEY